MRKPKKLDERRRKEKRNPRKERRMKKKNVVLGVILTVIALCVCVGTTLYVYLYAGSGSVEIALTEDAVSVEAPYCKVTIAYSEIETIELRTVWIRGRRTKGLSSSEMQSGNYKNEEFGDYLCATYTSSDVYIVIKRGNEKTVVLNQADNAATEALFRNIQEKRNIEEA